MNITVLKNHKRNSPRCTAGYRTELLVTTPHISAHRFTSKCSGGVQTSYVHIGSDLTVVLDREAAAELVKRLQLHLAEV